MTHPNERLGERTWTQVAASGDGAPHVLLIPLGSCEQHGPHLPIDTDTRIAVAVAEAAAARTSTAMVAPALAYGSSGEHQSFAGTISIGTDALRVVLVELARSASRSFRRIVFVNGHGGNQQGISSAVDQLVIEGHAVASWSPRIAGGDLHAGRTETSLLLAIAPEHVRLDMAEAGNLATLAELWPVLRTDGVAAVSENGVLGDPTGASADEGREFLERLVNDLIAVIHGDQTSTVKN